MQDALLILIAYVLGIFTVLAYFKWFQRKPQNNNLTLKNGKIEPTPETSTAPIPRRKRAVRLDDRHAEDVKERLADGPVGSVRAI
jgi:hypothetical protein